MSENKMRNFTLTDEALAVFTLLHDKGPRYDDQLPNATGMAELSDLGLAKKDPQDGERNMLTKLGSFEAGVYFAEITTRAPQVEPVPEETEAEEPLNDGEPVDEVDPA
jgi:hypothetical protein